MNIGIWAPLGPFGTLGPYLFSYLGPLWALLGPLALTYFRILDPFGPFGTLGPFGPFGPFGTLGPFGPYGPFCNIGRSLLQTFS